MSLMINHHGVQVKRVVRKYAHKFYLFNTVLRKNVNRLDIAMCLTTNLPVTFPAYVSLAHADDELVRGLTSGLPDFSSTQYGFR